MKIFSIILIFGFAWQTTYAEITFNKIKTCLVENGFTDEIPDLERVEAIGDPENADRLKDVSQEKMAGVFACIYEKLYPEQNLNVALKSLIERDDKVSEEEKKEMMKTLSTCNKNASGDNHKLLSCVNVIASPFDDLIAAIRDIPDTEAPCYSKCSYSIGEMYKMEENRNKLKVILEIINEKKLGCFLACIIDASEKNKKDQPNFVQNLSNRITLNKKYNENEKKEMLEKLNTCKAQATEGEDKTDKLINCLRVFKPPFVDLF